MKGIIKKVNYQRDLAIFEDDTGSFGYFELFGGYEPEEDDIIVGELHSLGSTRIKNMSNGEYYDIFIEDFDMSFAHVMEMVFNS